MIPIPEGSKCAVKSRILCSYYSVLDNSEVVVERCKFCGKRVSYNKKHGKIDNQRYLREHFRDFLQPVGGTRDLYREVYGVEHLKKSDAHWKEARKEAPTVEEMMEKAKDALRTMKRKSFS